MRAVELDVSECETKMDFVKALKAVIEAPEGHGSSPDAFVDSMVWGGMNRIDPPYEVRVTGSENTPPVVRECIDLLARSSQRGTGVAAAQSWH